MRQALNRSYPPGSSALRRVFGPVIDPWTYARALHLVAMFPLGIAYFVFLVTTLAIGISLSWTLIGPPILLVTLYVTRWIGDGEAWVARHLHRMELRRPPTTIERGSYRQQVWERIIDPTSWTGLVYLAVQFPIGLAMFVLLVTLTTIGGVFVAAPFVVGPESVIDFDGVWVINEPAEAWWLPLVGVGTLLLEVHLVNLLSVLHAGWARQMLGSRAPHIVPGAPLEDGDAPPPEAAGGEPDGPSGPDGPGGPGGGRAPSPPPTGEAPGIALETPGAPGAPMSVPLLVPPLPRTVTEASTAVLASLTPREQDVLRLIARGYSNAEIAEAFVVSEGTVKTHVKRVLAKLAVRDRTQAAVWAFERGFVQPSYARTLPEEQAGHRREPVPLRASR